MESQTNTGTHDVVATNNGPWDFMAIVNILKQCIPGKLSTYGDFIRDT